MATHGMTNGYISEQEIDRMKELRAKGLSNSQIAIEMGRSPISIRRHIGVQPVGCKAAYASLSAHATGDKFDKTPEPQTTHRTKLKIVRTITTYEGQNLTYKLDTEGQFRITSPTGENLTMTTNEMYVLLSELCDIAEMITAPDKKQ